jgi:hypothetical protein
MDKQAMSERFKHEPERNLARKVDWSVLFKLGENKVDPAKQASKDSK